MTKKSKLPFFISLCILISLVAGYFLIPGFRQFIDKSFQVLISGDRDQINQWVEQLGFWGPLAIILGLVIQMFMLVVPTLVLMIVAVLAYGPWMGGFYALTGILLASATAYYIGFAGSNVFLNKLMGKKTRDRLTGYTDKFGVWLVFIARIHPMLSNDTVSFVMGIVRLNFWKFMLATIAATLPMLALIGYLGSDMQRLKTGLFWLSGIAIVAGIVYFIYRGVHR